jgi:DNA invertase Pin-like site-specific DNA recombinase
MDAKLTSERLQRKAIVYVRQSSMVQATHSLESQRRQCNLNARALELGFNEIEVIDEGLERSCSGCVDRPGFEHLVAEVRTGGVGGVICVEASRLARNGKHWRRLIDLCALFDIVIIDPEGVYDPNLTNDRLFLGLKGAMSEFDAADHRRFQEKGRETIRITGEDATGSAADRDARTGDSGATETDAGPDGVTDPGGRQTSTAASRPPQEAPRGCKANF